MFWMLLALHFIVAYVLICIPFLYFGRDKEFTVTQYDGISNVLSSLFWEVVVFVLLLSLFARLYCIFAIEMLAKKSRICMGSIKTLDNTDGKIHYCEACRHTYVSSSSDADPHTPVPADMICRQEINPELDRWEKTSWIYRFSLLFQ